MHMLTGCAVKSMPKDVCSEMANLQAKVEPPAGIVGSLKETIDKVCACLRMNFACHALPACFGKHSSGQ